MSAFPYCFGAIVGVEGAFSKTANDPGDWTGGKIGVGLWQGTAWGIASSQYQSNLQKLPPIVRSAFPPTVQYLTLDLAQAYYRPLYWDAHNLDSLPAPMALLWFDAVVNGGDPVRWLQEAVGTYVDGDWGPVSARCLASAMEADKTGVVREFSARHLAYYASLHRDDDELGWARRAMKIATLAFGLAGGLPEIIISS